MNRNNAIEWIKNKTRCTGKHCQDRKSFITEKKTFLPKYRNLYNFRTINLHELYKFTAVHHNIPKKEKTEHKRCTDRKKNHKIQAALSWVAQIFFFLVFVLLKKKKRKRKQKNKESLSVQSMETYIYIYITKTTLVLSNTPNTNGFTYEKRNSWSNMKYKKEHVYTQQNIIYWHFPYMYGHVLSLPYVVQ